MPTGDTERAAPAVTPLTEPYWAAAAEGTLALQHCGACERFVHFPASSCPTCGRGDGLSFEPVSGRGVVYTYSVVHRTFAPGFDDRVPYVIAWIDVPEQPGLRVFGNVLDCDPDDVRIGMPVEVCFETIEGFGPVPNFRPASAAGAGR
ncbi:MAG TPA: OB-fold domain-containing protein [Acidimicrobiales bacterium]